MQVWDYAYKGVKSLLFSILKDLFGFLRELVKLLFCSLSKDLKIYVIFADYLLQFLAEFL